MFIGIGVIEASAETVGIALVDMHLSVHFLDLFDDLSKSSLPKVIQGFLKDRTRSVKVILRLQRSAKAFVNWSIQLLAVSTAVICVIALAGSVFAPAANSRRSLIAASAFECKT